MFTLHRYHKTQWVAGREHANNVRELLGSAVRTPDAPCEQASSHRVLNKGDGVDSGHPVDEGCGEYSSEFKVGESMQGDAVGNCRSFARWNYMNKDSRSFHGILATRGRCRLTDAYYEEDNRQNHNVNLLIPNQVAPVNLCSTEAHQISYRSEAVDEGGESTDHQ